MNYYFPEIEHISQVLDAIEGRSEFIHVDKGDYQVINYVVANEDTFKMEGPDDIRGALRREARGLIFGPDGRVMSRAYHKFFNLGEKDETQLYKLLPLAPHQILLKADGSFIRLIKTGGQYRLASKMGVTDTSIAAEKYLTDEQKEWLIHYFNRGFTPILEYVGPDNRIVVKYDKPELILTGFRDNLTGDYLADLNNVTPPFKMIDSFGRVDDLQKFIDENRSKENEEGVVVRFHRGHMLKIKWDSYVKIHKIKEKIIFDRNILDLILDEKLDDILPFLDEQDLARVKELEKVFWQDFENCMLRIGGACVTAKDLGDRKRIALELMPKLLPGDAHFVFKSLDGKPLREQLMEHVKKKINSNSSYDELREWMMKR